MLFFKKKEIQFSEIVKIVYANSVDQVKMTDIWIAGVFALGLKDNHLYQIYSVNENRPIVFDLWKKYNKEFSKALPKTTGIEITYPGGFQ